MWISLEWSSCKWASEPASYTCLSSASSLYLSSQPTIMAIFNTQRYPIRPFNVCVAVICFLPQWINEGANALPIFVAKPKSSEYGSFRTAVVNPNGPLFAYQKDDVWARMRVLIKRCPRVSSIIARIYPCPCSILVCDSRPPWPQFVTLPPSSRRMSMNASWHRHQSTRATSADSCGHRCIDDVSQTATEGFHDGIDSWRVCWME